ncbi:UNVERIFIED_CONTAM: hypothetical protein FKN15_020243 [Acipenser sinensis]
MQKPAGSHATSFHCAAACDHQRELPTTERSLQRDHSSLRRVCLARAVPLIWDSSEDNEDSEDSKGPREKGRMRFHRLQNVQIALDFLKQRQVKLVNIRNDDITDGNPKLTLGLIWTIILHFQVRSSGNIAGVQACSTEYPQTGH